jgi:hypothetical protein
MFYSPRIAPGRPLGRDVFAFPALMDDVRYDIDLRGISMLMYQLLRVNLACPGEVFRIAWQAMDVDWPGAKVVDNVLPPPVDNAYHYDS